MPFSLSSLSGLLGAKTIGFALEDDGDIKARVTLTLPPEDFARTDTSRATVHHTLGSAWVDNFGPGLPNIQISGTTGWKGGGLLSGDGESRWKAMRDDIVRGWHTSRKAAVTAGRDPNTVKLIYIDQLNGITAEVVPMSLTLRRSKSRPLLIQYQLNLIVVDDNKDQLAYLAGGSRRAAANEEPGFLDSIKNAIKSISDAIGAVKDWVATNIIGPVQAFMTTAIGVFNSVVSFVRSAVNVVGQVLALPLQIARAGYNVFATLARGASSIVRSVNGLANIGRAFNNIYCWLLKARSRRLAYNNYSPWYGASACSSLSGGRPASPLLGTNPFMTLPSSATSITGLSFSSAGQGALQRLAGSDPVQRPMSSATLSSELTTVQREVRAA